MKQKMKRIALLVVVLICAILYANGEWYTSIYFQNAESKNFTMTDAISRGGISQEFTMPYDGMNYLQVRLAKNGEHIEQVYTWKLREKTTGEVIQEGTITNDDLEKELFVKKKMVQVSFPIQKDSKGKTYVFTVQDTSKKEALSKDSLGSLSAYLAEPGKHSGKLEVMGEHRTESLVLKVGAKRFHVETFCSFLGIVIYIYLFIRFMYKLFR